jgi:hypothetical protein
MRLAGRNSPRADTLKLLHDWLQSTRCGKWLLILDNLDNADFLFESTSHTQSSPSGAETGRNEGRIPLISYLPQCAHGSILAMTRSRDALLKLVEDRDAVSVGPMNETDTLNLPRKKLRQHYDQERCPELAATLEYMPLAIVQAAA